MFNNFSKSYGTLATICIFSPSNRANFGWWGCLDLKGRYQSKTELIFFCFQTIQRMFFTRNFENKSLYFIYILYWENNIWYSRCLAMVFQPLNAKSLPQQWPAATQTKIITWYFPSINLPFHPSDLFAITFHIKTKNICNYLCIFIQTVDIAVNRRLNVINHFM